MNLKRIRVHKLTDIRFELGVEYTIDAFISLIKKAKAEKFHFDIIPKTTSIGLYNHIDRNETEAECKEREKVEKQRAAALEKQEKELYLKLKDKFENEE